MLMSFPLFLNYPTGPRPKKKKEGQVDSDNSNNSNGNGNSRHNSMSVAATPTGIANSSGVDKDQMDAAQRRQSAPALYAGILMDKDSPIDSLRRPSTSTLDSSSLSPPAAMASMLAFEKEQRQQQRQIKQDMADKNNRASNGIGSLADQFHHQFPSSPPQTPTSLADAYMSRALAANPALLAGMPGLMNMNGFAHSLGPDGSLQLGRANAFGPLMSMEGLLANSPLSPLAQQSHNNSAMGPMATYPYLPYAHLNGLFPNHHLNALSGLTGVGSVRPPPQPQPPKQQPPAQPSPPASDVPLPKQLADLMPSLVRELITQTALFLASGGGASNGSKATNCLAIEANSSGNASPAGDDDEEEPDEQDEQMDDDSDNELDGPPGALDLSNKPNKHI